MGKKFIFQLCSFLFLLISTACTNFFPKNELRIGLDPTFFSSPVGNKQGLVYAFTIELFEEIFKDSSFIPIYIDLSYDNLFDSLTTFQTDLIVSSIAKEIIIEAKYDFSSMFLSLGDVFVTRVDEPLSSFKDFSGKIIALSQFPNLISLFKNYPEINLTYYLNITDVLESIVNYNVDGAIIPYLPLASHLSSQYQHLLNVNKEKLTDIGLSLVTLLGKNEKAIQTFNKQLNIFSKNGKLEALLKKWNLVI